MTARIRFEDMTGKALGFVDYKGGKLHPSKGVAGIAQYWETIEKKSPQQFMEHYGKESNSTGRLNFRLLDSEDDQEDYPEESAS